ncbi:MAG: prolipoprotein diacylglyceryl transferase [bacterium]|nr:prolipoprotein diacylglyceryl transferase [bacterium]
MRPILFDIGPVSVSSFGFFLGLGFLVASIMIVRAARHEHWNRERILDVFLATVFVGFLGARLVYIFLHPYEFEGSLARMVQFYRYPGFSFPGVLFGGLLGFFIAGRRSRLPLLLMADAFALAYLAAELFGGVGCFLSGCMVGSITYMPWGIVIPGMIGRRHPIPVYLFLVTLVLLFLLTHIRGRFAWYGTKQSVLKPGLFLFVVLSFLSLRTAVVDFVRDDSVYWFGARLYQLVGLTGFFLAAGIGYQRQERNIGDDLKGLLGTLAHPSEIVSLLFVQPWRSVIVFFRGLELQKKRKNKGWQLFKRFKKS